LGILLSPGTQGGREVVDVVHMVVGNPVGESGGIAHVDALEGQIQDAGIGRRFDVHEDHAFSSRLEGQGHFRPELT